MDTLAVTSVTNFILASEMFFLAGMMIRTPKGRFSAAWFWGGALFALASSALIGGIDHGFVEPAGLSRYVIQRPNWIVVGLATFCVLLAAGRQFLAPRLRGPVLAIGAVQALGVDVWRPLDRNGLYHVISVVGVVFMYWGWQRLKVV